VVKEDTTLNKNVIHFNGKDDYLELKNQVLYKDPSGIYSYFGTSFNQDIFFDFSHDFTVEFWVKPNLNYMQYLDSSKFYTETSDSDHAQCLFNYMGMNLNNVTGSDFGSNVGLTISLGPETSIDWDITKITAVLRSPFINNGDTIVLSIDHDSGLTYGQSRTWIKVTFDIILKNGLQAKLTTWEDGPITFTDSQTLTIPQGFKLNPSEIYNSSQRLSDIYIGARHYSEENVVGDFFYGDIGDIKITKK
jgi:hypothetical protein